MMKILLCDDHAVFRDGLRAVLADLSPKIEWLDAATSEQGLEIASQHDDLDLVMLDLQMPGIGGVEGLRQFRRTRPAVPVVIVSASNSAAEIRGVIDAGAAGFLPKSLGRDDMLSALRLIQSGGVFVPREALAISDGDPMEHRRSAAAKLTRRQIEVLALVARGLTNKEIHGVLGIAENTVKTHLAAILEVLQASNRTEAAVIARELGIKAPGEE